MEIPNFDPERDIAALENDLALEAVYSQSTEIHEQEFAIHQNIALAALQNSGYNVQQLIDILNNIPDCTAEYVIPRLYGRSEEELASLGTNPIDKYDIMTQAQVTIELTYGLMSKTEAPNTNARKDIELHLQGIEDLTPDEYEKIMIAVRLLFDEEGLDPLSPETYIAIEQQAELGQQMANYSKIGTAVKPLIHAIFQDYIDNGMIPAHHDETSLLRSKISAHLIALRAFGPDSELLRVIEREAIEGMAERMSITHNDLMLLINSLDTVFDEL